MYDTSTPTSKPKADLRKRIVIVTVILLGVTGFIIAGFTLANVIRRAQLVGEVQATLETIPTIMQKISDKGNGYPAAISDVVSSTKTIKLTGGGSFDGSDYCVTGSSTVDTTIHYYIDSTSAKSKAGSCQSAANLPQPTKVGAVAVSLSSSDKIVITWGSSTYATKYGLECATNSTFSENIVKTTVTELHGSCEKLKPGQTYFIRVRGENSSQGVWSDVAKAITSNVSMPPTNLTLKVISSTRIDYSWAAVSGAKSYILESATDVSFTKDVHSMTINGTSGSSTGLKAGTTYFYHVKAITDSFDSSQAAFSEEFWATTQS